jgi:hypothetical protein
VESDLLLLLAPSCGGAALRCRDLGVKLFISVLGVPVSDHWLSHAKGSEAAYVS